jgi:hypothetical protein
MFENVEINVSKPKVYLLWKAECDLFLVKNKIRRLCFLLSMDLAPLPYPANIG